MEQNKQNEELQTRREFFKKAAIGTLPFIGGIIGWCARPYFDSKSMPNVSTSVKDAVDSEEEPMGCSADGCSYTCSTSCYKGNK